MITWTKIEKKQISTASLMRLSKGGSLEIVINTCKFFREESNIIVFSNKEERDYVFEKIQEGIAGEYELIDIDKIREEYKNENTRIQRK